MDPFGLLLLGLGGSAALGGLSTAISGAQAASSARAAYKYQSKLLHQQQNFYERMSNTAHQREIADLRLAGLNPILTAMGGSGASSAAVSAPSVAQEHPIDVSGLTSTGKEIASEFGSLSRAALKREAEKADLELENLQAQKANTQALTEKYNADTLATAERVSKEGQSTPFQIFNILKSGIERVGDSAKAAGGLVRDVVKARVDQEKAGSMKNKFERKEKPVDDRLPRIYKVFDHYNRHNEELNYL